MDENRLRQLLASVRDQRVGLDEALTALRDLPYEDLGYARVDHHRALREGLPEVVLGIGKSPDQIAGIAQSLAARNDRLLVTRASEEAYEAVRRVLPEAEYRHISRTIVLNRRPQPLMAGVALLCAGTADLPVADEAAVTAELIGSAVDRLYDVGVAGIHRLFAVLPRIRAARAIIVVAGMEGALPSVVAGLIATPVVAVPTSVGYGASFSGVTALLSMLNSCAAGVSVVNIDNGFGAGYIAAMINRQSTPVSARSEGEG
ncbi:MAG TPA: nickel pincer cofactor biosynthesis protein LarB [Dehalococcoidia bacterium]|nr:nickel pincer cofactor biosynthesis protein LarB [Dehalococcoidia bacterium]